MTQFTPSSPQPQVRPTSSLKKPAAALALLGTTLLLGACSGNGTVNPPSSNPPTVISGTVKPWTQGQTNTISPPLFPELSTAVNTTGNFDLKLPTVSTMTTTYANTLNNGSDLSTSCGSGVTVTAGLKYAIITDLAIGSISPTYYTYSSYQNGVLNYKGWWFANKAATITATNANCGVSEFFGQLTANLNLKAGWNVVNYTQTSANSTVSYNLTTGTQTNARMTWQPNPISTQSLQPQNRQGNPWGFMAR